MKHIIPIYILLLPLLSCASEPNSSTKQVKNVILMIGDGMGTAQIHAGLTANKGQLHLERAQYVGFSKTASADDYTTDSGAGGTAIATGHKTNNKTIGLNDKGKPVATLLELSEARGLATGLIATSTMTHATPASFIAHHPSRYNEKAIATHFPGSGIDIFIGGGRKYFVDSIDVIQQLTNEGYHMVYKLADVDPEDTRNIGCLAADEAMPKMQKGRGNFLPEATQKALQKLAKNPEGFFLMVESSQIDWAGHAMDIDYMTSELIDFDNTIRVAFDFADKNPGTLVIVTADHETGGLSIIDGNMKTGELEANFGTDWHTGVMVPVFTYGAGAENFAGIYPNTGIFERIASALQLNETD